MFAEQGPCVTIYPGSTFINPENIHLKDRIILSESCWIHGGSKTLIGNFIHIHCFVSVAGGGVLILEDFVGVCAGVRIVNGSDLVEGEGLVGPTIPAELRAVRRSFVHCERHVFLGTNAVIHPGVTIGEGAVIGSGSVVTRDIAPWTINQGVPARPVRDRPRETVKRLEDAVYAKLGVTPFDAAPWSHLKSTRDFLPNLDPTS